MIRLDINFKKGFKPGCDEKKYKKLIAYAAKICDVVPCFYRFFTFQEEPQFFIEFGEMPHTEKKLKQAIKDLPDFIESAKIVRPKARKYKELDVERQTLDAFASFVFGSVLKNRHKYYSDFNERKLVHVFMNMRFVSYAAEINFCLDHVKILLGIKTESSKK